MAASFKCVCQTEKGFLPFRSFQAAIEQQSQLPEVIALSTTPSCPIVIGDKRGVLRLFAVGANWDKKVPRLPLNHCFLVAQWPVVNMSHNQPDLLNAESMATNYLDLPMRARCHPVKKATMSG